MKNFFPDPSKELWFCGQQFTAADITLCVFLGRLDHIGLGERYHSNDKRPHLHAYWTEAKKHPSVRKVVVNLLRNMKMMKLRNGLKVALPIVGGMVTVGLAVGLAILFGQKK